jgi:quercetin dioxygenase-like cupin family protein
LYTINKQIATQETKALEILRIFKNSAFEVRTIAMEQGAIFPEHTSPTEALLIMLEGAIVFHIKGKAYSIQRQESFHFPANITHWVEARADSKFILIR